MCYITKLLYLCPRTAHNYFAVQNGASSLGNKFIIETCKKSLKELMTRVVQTPDQHYYLLKLLSYNCDIMYRSFKENRVANALSRLENHHNSYF